MYYLHGQRGSAPAPWLWASAAPAAHSGRLSGRLSEGAGGSGLGGGGSGAGLAVLALLWCRRGLSSPTPRGRVSALLTAGTHRGWI